MPSVSGTCCLASRGGQLWATCTGKAWRLFGRIFGPKVVWKVCFVPPADSTFHTRDGSYQQRVLHFLHGGRPYAKLANLGNSWLPPIQPIESGIWLEAKGKSLTSSLPRLSCPRRVDLSTFLVLKDLAANFLVLRFQKGFLFFWVQLRGHWES